MAENKFFVLRCNHEGFAAGCVSKHDSDEEARESSEAFVANFQTKAHQYFWHHNVFRSEKPGSLIAVVVELPDAGFVKNQVGDPVIDPDNIWWFFVEEYLDAMRESWASLTK